MKNPYRYYQQFTPFTDDQAWTLFKIAAIAEAVGWTLLIGGILLRDYVLAGNGIPVTIAGRIHGMVFVGYVLAVLALAPSLGWSWYRTLIAGAFSVPPYGSLVYELWSAGQRKLHRLKRLIVSASMA
jgi:integral membrane protein